MVSGAAGRESWVVRRLRPTYERLLDISTRDFEKVLYFNSYIVLDPGNLPLLKKQILTEKEYQEYKQKYGMKVDLLSDFNREVTVRYGVLNEARFFSNRAYFLIDRNGIVQWAHVEENPSLKRTNQEILVEVDRMT